MLTLGCRFGILFLLVNGADNMTLDQITNEILAMDDAQTTTHLHQNRIIVGWSVNRYATHWLVGCATLDTTSMDDVIDFLYEHSVDGVTQQ